MTLSFRLAGILTIFLGWSTLHAQQINVVNQGMLISVQQGATLTINGDYTDNSGTVNFGANPNDAALTLDAPVFLSGTMYVSGNITNNSSTSTTLIYEFESPTLTGTVVLNGAGDQSIGGTVDSYFPNLTLNKSGSFVLNRNIEVDNALTLTQGRVDLNGRTLSLGNYGLIASENEVNKIMGTSGSVVSAQYQLSTPPPSVANYRGVGIGYQLGAQNFVDVVWTRYYQPGNFSVANNVNVLRAIRMETATSATFPSITFHFHDSELNSLAADATLALYFSSDNGVSWTKASSVVDALAHTVTASNVSAVAGSGNIFTLAAATCSTLPSATIASAAPAVSAGVVNICDNANLDLSVASVVTNDYIWTTPVGSVTTYNYPVFAVDYDAAPTQSGSYSVFVRDIKGCENTGAVTVNVRAIPVAQIAITPDPNVVSLCFGNQLQFSDASTVAGGSAITAWQWNFNDVSGTTSTLQNPQFTYTTVGDKSPSLIVTSQYNCVSPIVNRPITIQSLPTPSFTITDGAFTITERCEDTNITLVNGSTYLDYNGAASSTLSYQWTFDDGNNSTATSPTHQYAAAGSYDIVLRATVDVTQCYSETTLPITINPEPIPNFTPMIAGVGVNEGCEGVYVDFQNTSTMPGGSAMTFSWDFADGTGSTNVNPTKQYVQPDVYAVVLTATSVTYGCFESFTLNLTEHPAPKGTFTVADPDICVPEQAVLTNASNVLYGTLTNEWDFGDGNTIVDNASQINHSYAQPQQYRVTLTRTTDEGCTNSVSRNVIVHPTPVPSFVHVNACDGEEVVFYNNSVIQSGEPLTYSWDFGDASSLSSATEPVHIFPLHGNYNVSITATSTFGCSNSANNQVTVYQKPTFDLGASLTGCQIPFTIDPSTDGAAYLPVGSSYVWKNGLAQTVGTSDELQVSVSDAYSVTITTPSPELCSSTIAVPLFLFQSVNLGSDISACSSFILDAEAGLPGEKIRSNQTTYEWQKDGVIVSTQQTLNVVESGLYKITLTRTVAGVSCASTDEVDVQIDLPLSVTLPQQQTICEGQSIILDAGVTANSYRWTRLNTGEEFNGQTLEVDEAGDYRLDVITNGCTATAISTVIVSPGPSVSFALPSLAACVGDQVIITDYSYSNVGVISNRVWDFGDNTTAANPVTVAKTYNAPGTYEISLTATTDNGCSSDFTQQLIVKANPVSDFTIQDGCANSNLTVSNNSTPGATYAWDFGDATSSNEMSPAKSFDDDGQFTVTLDVQMDGCSASVDHVVTINPIPQLEFGDQITTCGNSILLDAGNAGASFRWFDPANGNATLATSQQFVVNSNTTIGLEVVNGFGCQASDVADVVLNVPVAITLGSDRSVCDEETLDAGYLPGGSYTWSSGETNRELTVTVSGFYQVDVIDQNGCTASASVTLTVNSTPVISPINDQTICSGGNVLLDAGNNALYTYTWSTGATTSSISAATAGIYTVEVTNQNCAEEESVLVTVNQSPVADFTGANACNDQSLTFQNSSTSNAGALQYLWNFGDGTFSTLAEPSKAYANAGNYPVALEVKDQNGCVNQIADQVEIYAVPVATFDILDGCSVNNLVIANNSTFSGTGALNYQWNFGNGQTSASETPVYAYPTGGNYQVNLLVTSAQGCSDNFLQSVTIGTTPSLTGWVNNISSCNASVILDAGNAGATYEWSENSTNQTLTVSQSGQYTVEISSADGCAITASANVLLYSPAAPLLADQTEDCGQVHLDPVANAATYLWSTGARTKTIDVTSSGTYTVQLITQNLCISNDVTLATVNPIPIIDLGNDRTSCAGETLALDATSTVPVTYAWSTGATTSAISISQSGKYVVKLTSAKNCVFKDSLVATFHALPVINLSDQITSCGQVTLDAVNPGSSYLWSTGSRQQTINTSTSGSYWIEVVNVNNCVAKDTVDVSILPVPVVNLGVDVTLCNGQTTRLDAGTSGNQYLWSDNSTARYLTAGATGIYQVAVKNSVGCIGTDNVRVTVRPRLALELGSDRLLCNNAGQYLSAGVDNVSYLWGSTTGINAMSKTIRVERSGTYWVEITDSFSCKAKDSVAVSPTTENITANFLVPTVVGQGDLVHFAQLSEPAPTTFRWTFGDGGLSNEENPVHRYFRTGDFTATLVVSNAVCTDTLSKTITVRNGRVEVQPSPELPTLIDFISAGSYPNPTRGIFKVDVALTAEAEVLVAVYSLNGVTMDERRKKIVQEVFEFDITNSSDGMYIIRVIVEGKVRIFKLLKSGGF